jgi:4-phytase/acid phosphatase
MDPATNRAAILARIGGDFTSVTREYSQPLTEMAAALCPTGTSVTGARCAAPSTLSSLEVGPNGHVAIKGPIGVGSTAAEQVAWGRLSGDAELTDLLSLHRLYVDLTLKTVPIARQKGSNMLAQIVETLVDGHKFPGHAPSPEPVRFALLMGHDTNISSVQGLLQLGWQIPGFQANDASPGGALAFELYREIKTDQRYVRVAYYAQTLPQMRQAATLSLTDPPGMQAVDLPACAAWAHERSCPLPRFVEIAKTAIDPGCVSLKP